MCKIKKDNFGWKHTKIQCQNEGNIWNKTFKNNKQGAKEKENKQDTTDIITKSKITDK